MLHAQDHTVPATDGVGAVAARHRVSEDAVLTLVHALERGGGEQAQFSHRELGGMGQWSRGGMVMVGDMFDTGLKARVDALCSDVSDLMRKGELAVSQSGSDRAGPADWWPSACGTPSSSGSQNDMRYAYFPETRRLAIHQGGTVRLYDTGDHRIAGVSQQQSGSQDLSFASQHGTIRLHDLTPVHDRTPKAGAASSQEREASQPHLHGDHKRAVPPSASADDVFGKLERLHDLHRKGIIDETEFREKKRELLALI